MSTLRVEQKSIKQLFQDAKGGFLIPDYQRPYEWGEDECKTLWDDLISFAFPDNDYSKFREDEYFLGPIVMFRNKQNQLEIIDGQQRITTLMLLLRVFYGVLVAMNDPHNNMLKDEIGKCIWSMDSSYNIDLSKLKIDSQVFADEDRADFHSILKDGKCEGGKSRYAQNYEFFVKNINEFTHTYPSYFAFFPPRVLENCVLLPIEADSQDTALRIFSTLNDRGKPLADADIFKAQFYNYYKGKGKKDEFMREWKELEKIAVDVFKSSSGSPLDELFNQYMHYQRALNENKNTTVEGLRKFYEGGGNYPLLKNEQTLSNLRYLAEFWRDVAFQDKERFSERVLKKLFILHYAPNSMWRLITSVYFLFKKDNKGLLEEEPFCKFLDRVTAILLAYTITFPGISSLRAPMYSEMVKIAKGEEVDFKESKIDEQTLRTAIDNFVFSNNRSITKSMLTWWAFKNEEQKLLSLSSRFDIEHIYPRNRLEMNNEDDFRVPQNIELLGNKSLLEKQINIRATDYTFKDKKKYYLATPSKAKKEPTQIAELINLAKTHDDFKESDIKQRNLQIILAFTNFLLENDLLEASDSSRTQFG